jgi:hypothetical protein
MEAPMKAILERLEHLEGRIATIPPATTSGGAPPTPAPHPSSTNGMLGMQGRWRRDNASYGNATSPGTGVTGPRATMPPRATQSLIMPVATPSGVGILPQTLAVDGLGTFSQSSQIPGGVVQWPCWAGAASTDTPNSSQPASTNFSARSATETGKVVCSTLTMC